MTPDQYTLLYNAIKDNAEATRQLVQRFDDNLQTQNRLIRQVANAQAQAGVLNTRVTSVDRTVRELVESSRDLEDLLEALPAERLARWDGAAAIVGDTVRVQGWDEASKHVRNMRWLVTRSWKAFLAIGGSAGVAIALVLKLLGA